MLTDITMPEQEGIETLMAIRTLYADAKVIGMSGYVGLTGGSAAFDPLRLMMALGASGVLAKPMRREELLEAVAACCGAGPAATPAATGG